MMTSNAGMEYGVLVSTYSSLRSPNHGFVMTSKAGTPYEWDYLLIGKISFLKSEISKPRLRILRSANQVPEWKGKASSCWLLFFFLSCLDVHSSPIPSPYLLFISFHRILLVSSGILVITTTILLTTTEILVIPIYFIKYERSEHSERTAYIGFHIAFCQFPSRVL